MNDLGLKGKVAIVTGAGGGIGREIALALACEGVKIVANDIGVSLSGEGGSIQPAEETCGLITQKGGEAIPDNHSVTSWSSASKIIENTLDNFKRIDIVINNAGILRKAFNCLPIMVKPGGKLCVDYYWKRFLTMMHAKYFFRPFTKKMSHEKLFNIIKFLLPSLLYISNAFLKIPFIGKPLQRLLPIANYKNIYPLSDEQNMEWSLLDTFDMLSPTYDNPQTIKNVKKWYENHNFENIECLHAGHLVARGKKTK